MKSAKANKQKPYTRKTKQNKKAGVKTGMGNTGMYLSCESLLTPSNGAAAHKTRECHGTQPPSRMSPSELL